MSEEGKAVIIPTSSGAASSEEWRNDDYDARATRAAKYRADRSAFIRRLWEENARLRSTWRDPSEWRGGVDCLICCRGVNPEPGYRGSVSHHYGMAAFPAGTIAWMPLPELPPLAEKAPEILSGEAAGG